MLLNLQNFLPKKFICFCFRPNKKQKKILHGYRYLLQELQIQNMIQMLRVVTAACKETRTSEQWENLEKQHKLLAFSDIGSDSDSNDQL